MHWLFWMGVGLIVSGIVSVGIILAGEGPPSFIQEVYVYSVGWIVAGVVLALAGIAKQLVFKNKTQ